jgi:pimeloyl-ACP methyl ester carboxylesterase
VRSRSRPTPSPGLNHVRAGSGEPLLLLHSLGGSVVGVCTAGFWRRAPENSNERLNRTRRAGRALLPVLRPMMSTAEGRRRALGRFVHHPERLSPDEALSMARAYVTAPAYPRASALMRAGEVGSLDDLKVPVTLAWAEYDDVVRSRPLRDGALPKTVRQIELPDCGHVPTWDDPDLVARVVLEGTA